MSAFKNSFLWLVREEEATEIPSVRRADVEGSSVSEMRSGCHRGPESGLRMRRVVSSQELERRDSNPIIERT